MPYYRIAEIGGDGIGPEVVAEAVGVLRSTRTRWSPRLRIEAAVELSGWDSTLWHLAYWHKA